MTRQHGFSIIEIALVLLVVGIVGAVGYLGFVNFIMPKPAQLTQEAKKVDPTVIKVEKSADLEKADTNLDEIPLEDDSSFLDSTDF